MLSLISLTPARYGELAVTDTTQSDAQSAVPQEPVYGVATPLKSSRVSSLLHVKVEDDSMESIYATTSEELHGQSQTSLGLGLQRRQSFKSRDGAINGGKAFSEHVKSCDEMFSWIQSKWDDLFSLNPQSLKEATKAASQFKSVQSLMSKR